MASFGAVVGLAFSSTRAGGEGIFATDLGPPRREDPNEE